MMRDYQRQAIELAVLHDRVMRGREPRGSQERGVRMAHRLGVLRAHVMFPRHATHPVVPQPHRQDWA